MDKKADAKKDTDAEEASSSEPRWKLAMVLNMMVAALGVTLSGYMLISIGAAKQYLEFVDGYDGGDILMILAVVGFVSALVGLFGASVSSLSTSLKKYRRIRYLVFTYIGWGGGLVLLAGASFYQTFSTAGDLDIVLKPGFTASLIKYQKEAAVKTSIDAIQAQLKCCGNYNYTEWRTVSWTEAVSKTEVKIPASCCDKDTTAAQHINCIVSVPFGESIRLTPYAAGCVPALVAFYGQLLKKSTYLLVPITFMTGVVVFIVTVEARDPGAPELTEQEKENLLKTQEDGKKGGAKGKKKDDGGIPPGQAAALPAPLPQAVMAYPAMPYPYGYSAAPAMPMPMPR